MDLPKIKYAEAKHLRNRQKNSAFMKSITLSAELAVIVGKGPMPRSEVVKKLWHKKKNFQDSKNKRNINAAIRLIAVFGGKGRLTCSK